MNKIYDIKRRSPRKLYYSPNKWYLGRALTHTFVIPLAAETKTKSVFDYYEYTMKALLFTLLSIMTLGISYGATRTINSSGNWSDASNWVGSNIGGIGDDVVMNNNIDIVVQDGETITIGTLDVSKDGSITVDEGGSLTVTGAVNVDKDFTMTINGDFTVEGNLVIAKTLSLTVGSNGNMVVEGSATLAKDATLGVEGDLNVDGDFTAAQNTTINVGTSGTVTVDGSLSTGNDSNIDVGTGGTVSVGTDLDLGSGSTITGTGGVGAGSCTGAACSDSQLPITLLAFSVTTTSNIILVNWSTASEENFDYFDIEKSIDGETFSSIGTIKGNGNSNERIDYSFEDYSPIYGTSYYRLTAIDFDGTFEVFNAISVNHVPVELKVNVYPNPTQGAILNVNFGLPTEAQIKAISIFNLFGSIVKQTELLDNNSHLKMDLPLGTYIAKIQLDNYFITKRIVVN